VHGKKISLLLIFRANVSAENDNRNEKRPHIYSLMICVVIKINLIEFFFLKSMKLSCDAITK
jgi:hypothetical protein